MAVTQRLDLRQSQSLVMTPQLQQAIKLLQFSNLEVAAFVEQELEQNPLLERDEGAEGESADGAASDALTDASAVDQTGGSASDSRESDSRDMADREDLSTSADAPLDTDFSNVYDTAPSDNWTSVSGAGTGLNTGGGNFDEMDQSVDQRLSEQITLRRHLLDQLQVDIRDPVDRMIGIHLIEMLDEAGYVNGDLAELAGLLDCGLEQIEATLKTVQRFDPPGIFARSLRECLALQLADRNRLDPAMEALLDNLPLMVKRDMALLRRACGVDEEDMAEMIAEIKALNPKPAEAYDFEIADPIVPDILMRATPAGAWAIELNSDTLPRVLVSARYHALITSQALSKKEKDYISEQFQSANWLVKSLHQRATTILKVAAEIIRQQDAFFRKGVRHMKPLILRNIAEEIEMHESTVSRVTSNKYIATPRGIYELKYFFTAAISGANGEVHSAEAVRDRIKALIDAELKNKILSDDAIVTLLHKDDVDIARRTVAKYREAMHIPSSVQRRRDKAGRA